MKIPENYQTVMPYLIIKNAAEFIDFTRAVFNATELHRTMRDESIIRHGEIMIGGSTIMFADATDQFPVRTAGLFVYVENADETYKKAIEAKASPVMPVADQTYGRSGGIEDPFGNVWWITSPL